MFSLLNTELHPERQPVEINFYTELILTHTHTHYSHPLRTIPL